MSNSPAPNPDRLLGLDPVPRLLERVRAELAADFPPTARTLVSRAPGRLDVMGGIADYTGSLVCEATLDRAAAVALSPRDDRNIQVFSFNLFDEHKPFTFRVPLDALIANSADVLRRELDAPGRRWAGYLVGCLFVLHEQGYVDLRDPGVTGINLAVYSTVPAGAGVSSSAAIEVATMMGLVEYFGISRVGRAAGRGTGDAGVAPTDVGRGGPRPYGGETGRDVSPLDPMRVAALCQQVENRIVGAPCGIMDQVASCYGEAGSLLRMVCQPHELLPPLALPAGVRVLGINSNVKHSVGGGQYGRTRCAAFMAHRMILDKMAQMGAASGRTLTGDPTNGYLANLDPDDYRNFFRPYLPEWMRGKEFLDRHGRTIDAATSVEPDTDYPVQHAADHHILEARRVRKFDKYLEEAAALEPGPKRKAALDRAGHLMYASHLSYTNDAMLGADECDLLVQLVRQREAAGLYGAKITGGGSGGTVAVLADEGARADAAVGEVMVEYERRTGKTPELFAGSSPGAWHVGTAVVS